MNNASASDDITKVTFALYKSDDSWNKGDLVVADLHQMQQEMSFISCSMIQTYPSISFMKLLQQVAIRLLTEPLKITVTFTMDNKIEYTVDGQSGTYSITNPFTVVNYAELSYQIPVVSGLDQIHAASDGHVVITSVLYGGLQLSLILKRKREE